LNTTRYGLAIVGIVILFAIGLELFFLFSAEHGDGLEKTLEKAGVMEGEPVFKAPLDYGDDYTSAFLAGLLGFAVLFLLAYGLGRFVIAKRAP
jgi:hypothetical protein